MSSIHKKPIFYIVLAISIFSIIFSLLIYNKNSEIDEALKEQLKVLEISYKQGLDRFEVISRNVYVSFQNDKIFLDILAKAVNATKEQKKELHKRMYEHLKEEYERLRMLEVMQLQVLLPDNESLVRMHAPDRYGDDLTNIRYSIKEANKKKIQMFGFEQGRNSHAFRHIFPIYKDGKHIGAIDVSFSSTMLQNYTMRASNIHTHFIVNRKVFDSQAWKSNTQEPYIQSSEHKDFMFSMSDHMNHKRLDESKKTLIEPFRGIINKNIKTGKEFAIYKKIDNKVRVVSFLPIRNVKNDKTVAYLVSYTESQRIASAIENFKYFTIITVVIILVLFIVIWKIFTEGETLKKEVRYDYLTKLLNRKYFLKAAQEEFEKSKRFGYEFTIVMMDIDHFKSINDVYGHQNGDTVLQDISKIIFSSIRKFDVAARYGGEEFILLIVANLKNSHKVIENIRKNIQEHSFCNELNLTVTASFGIAEFKNDDSLEDIIKRADDALYNSKKTGRNKISVL